MKTARTRHQFYFPDDLSEKLDALAAKPGASKSGILTDALKGWLESKGSQELDQRFGLRLDRQSRLSERIERKLVAVTEFIGVFVQYQMTLVAHQPAFYDETGQLGRKRYHQLLDLAERRMVSGGVSARLAPLPSEGGAEWAIRRPISR